MIIELLKQLVQVKNETALETQQFLNNYIMQMVVSSLFAKPIELFVGRLSLKENAK